MSDKNFTLEDILAEYNQSGNINENRSDGYTSANILEGIDFSLDIYDDIKEADDRSDKEIITERNYSAEISSSNAAQNGSITEKSEIQNIAEIAARSEKAKLWQRKIPTHREIFLQRVFLFKQLVRRDFKARYKRAALGVLWSMLSPMFVFAAQAVIFSVLFKRGAHYVSFLAIGNVVYHYFTDSVTSGMFALAGNGGIISKINVPKSIFLLSKSVSCLLNFGLSMIIMLAICFVDGMEFHITWFSLIIPIVLMTVFNLGMGYILSAWFVFFKDTQYLFSIFTSILMYFSCIFYSPERFPENLRRFFYLNPVYCYIYYFRTIIMTNTLPSAKIHILCFFYALIALFIGLSVYKKNNNKFVYYF